MNITFIRNHILLLLLLLTAAVSSSAQAADTFNREQKIYNLFVTGQGDSLHTMLCEDFKTKLSPSMLGAIYKQLEMQFGGFLADGEWNEGTVQQTAVYYRDMQFEKMRLRFMLAYDGEGKINSLTVTPSPEQERLSSEQTASPAARNIEERDITVVTDSFRLPGVLTLPKATDNSASRKFPCVILVHGSGPSDRDETVGPNKPFRDLAWGLAERGIAVIRYDKRTLVYGSKSVSAGCSLDYDTETVDDALSAVSLAKSIPEISADNIYVMGHSQGGMLAPRIAERSGQLAGIIILSGPSRPLADVIVGQYDYLASLPGVPAEARSQAEEIKRQVANLKKIDTADFDESIPLPMGLPRSYWSLDASYDAVGVAAKLTIPILILQGERDYQVTMDDYRKWQDGLSSRKNVSFKSYPTLNHIMQEGEGMSTPQEYGAPSTIPGYVTDDVASFMHGLDEKE